MDLGLQNKTVLVTGGSKGIGRATAKAFAAEGANLIITSRDPTRLEETAGEISNETEVNVITFTADLSTEVDRNRLFDAFPDVDILVNNAGAITGGRLEDLTMQRWREGWELKVFGYIHMCQLYVSKMKERSAGTIINIIGMGGRAVRPDYICGAAGNAALIGFTNALGAETPKSNVRVFGINPSPTMTDRIITLARSRANSKFGDEERWAEMIDGDNFPFGRLKQPEEVGALAAMLACDQVHYLSGTVIDMDGGGQWLG